MRRITPVAVLVLVVTGVLYSACWGATVPYDAAVVQRAADGAVTLRGMMKDPDSFVLEGVFLMRPNKHGISDVCYFYRSHNSYGGYGGTGEARLNSKDRVEVIEKSDTAGGSIIDAINDPCKASREARDITIPVKTILSAPPSTTPARVLTPNDRKAWIDSFNDGMRKQSVVGYAEINGDVLTIHSERTSALRYHALLVNGELMDSLRQMRFATMVYTNDADQKHAVDLAKNVEVK